MDENDITEAMIGLIEQAPEFSDCTLDWSGGPSITISTPRNGFYVVIVAEKKDDEDDQPS
jgi:hypothetical protein